jgi:hypothetical protein
MQTQKRINRGNLVEDTLEYYLKQFCKLNEKKANLEFIDEMLADGIDINYLSKSRENVLFQVWTFLESSGRLGLTFLKLCLGCKV